MIAKFSRATRKNSRPAVVMAAVALEIGLIAE
jgi:hypothetical protein